MSLKDYHEPSRENFGYYELEKLEKEYKSEYINVFRNSLMDLVNSGIYSKLLDVYVNWDEPVPLLEWEGPFPLLSYNSMEIAFESPLLINAYDNLQRKPKIFFSDLITYNKFYYFFPFLEWVYSMYVERKLESEDIRRIFGSNIGEKIVFALEDLMKLRKYQI